MGNNPTGVKGQKFCVADGVGLSCLKLIPNCTSTGRIRNQVGDSIVAKPSLQGFAALYCWNGLSRHIQEAMQLDWGFCRHHHLSRWLLPSRWLLASLSSTSPSNQDRPATQLSIRLVASARLMRLCSVE